MLYIDDAILNDIDEGTFSAMGSALHGLEASVCENREWHPRKFSSSTGKGGPACVCLVP